MAASTDYLNDEPDIGTVEALPGTTLLEFGNAWCGHCRAAQRPLAEALSVHAGLRHLKVADGRGQPLGRHYGVKLWPTFVLLKDGREVARAVRPPDRSAIDRLLAAG